MPYLGNSHIAGDQINNFKVLDDISSHTSTFDGSASSVVSTSDNTIRIPEHRFIQGQRVTYNNGGGGNIGNLSSGTAYYVIKDTNNTIKLATSLSDANSSTAINISVLGSGTSHTLNVAFDGVNTKFKVTHNGGTTGRINNATQLSLAINNVIQRPNLNAVTFTEGFAIEDQHKIVFKVAPTSSDIFWGSILANTLPTFDISDNKIDNFTGDGSTTEFNLSNIPASNKSIMVTINGVLQHPSDGSTSRSYTLLANILQFTAAPGNGDEIQVRHIGFAGASTSDVTGFYGRTGNVVLTSNDHITTGNINAGIVTATTFVGNLTGNVSGNLTVGGVLTYEDVTNVDSIGIITARSGFKVLAGGANVVGVITARTNIHLEDYIHHLGDLTTKIGFPSAGNFTVDTSGSERLRIDSSGNLSIPGNNSTKDITYGDGSTTGYFRSITNVNRANADASIHMQQFKWNDTKVAEIKVLTGDDTTNKDNAHIVFETANSGTTVERLRITSTGRVGIGTTNPTRNLQIGSLDVDSYNVIRLGRRIASSNTNLPLIGHHSGDGTGSGLALCATSTNGAIHFFTGNGGNGFGANDNQERVIIKHDGLVGIGTNNPKLLLHLHQENSNATFAHFTNTTTGVNANQGVSFGLDSNEDATIYHYGNNNIRFATGGTEKVRITSAGKVSIGNESSPLGILHVKEGDSGVTSADAQQDTLFLENNGNAGLTIATPNANTGYLTFADPEDSNVGQIIYRHGGTNANSMAFFVNASERMVIKSDGKVGINSTSPQAQLDVCHNDGVYVKSVTNGNGAKVRFSDNGAESFTQIGTIEYKHQNNVIIDGTEEAFRIAGTEGTTGVQIEGLLKVTAQPCAVVYECTGPAGGAANAASDNDEPLHFNHVHINQGGMTISQDNGRIQVPVAGIYFVSYMVSGTVTNVDDNDGIELILLVNGNEYPATNSGAEPVFNFGLTANEEEFFCNNTLLVSLSKDDYVEVALDNIGNSDATINRGNFNVMLMS